MTGKIELTSEIEEMLQFYGSMYLRDQEKVNEIRERLTHTDPHKAYRWCKGISSEEEMDLIREELVIQWGWYAYKFFSAECDGVGLTKARKSLFSDRPALARLLFSLMQDRKGLREFFPGDNPPKGNLSWFSLQSITKLEQWGMQNISEEMAGGLFDLFQGKYQEKIHPFLGGKEELFLDLVFERLKGPERYRTMDEIIECLSTNIPGYTLIKYLGTGASGRVFLAKSTSLSFQSAIKVYEKETLCAGTTLGKAFKENLKDNATKSELTSFLELSHDHILKVSEPRISPSGQLYTVAPVLKDLSFYLKEKGREKLTWEEFKKIFEGILEGVRYLHKKRFLHRDIKPENILLTDELVAKVADLQGIISFEEQEKINEERPENGRWYGSLDYAAPEVILSGGFNHSVESDLYSIAVMAYNLLTGERLFDYSILKGGQKEHDLERVRTERAGEETYSKILKQRVLPSLDAVLEQQNSPCKFITERKRFAAKAFTKALAFSPKERYSSVEKMKTEIVHALDLIYEYTETFYPNLSI